MEVFNCFCMIIDPILVNVSRVALTRALRAHRVSRGGGTGGARAGGPWPPPPQKFEWVGQGMFWPPPPKFSPLAPKNWGAVVKIFAELLLSTLKCAKNFRLRRANKGRTYGSGNFWL